MRQVRSNGEIKWRGDLIHISSALIGESVAVEETEDGHWQVRFFDVPIGIIDQKTRKLRRCARACCFLPESGFPGEPISDSKFMLEDGGQHG